MLQKQITYPADKSARLQGGLEIDLGDTIDDDDDENVEGNRDMASCWHLIRLGFLKTWRFRSTKRTRLLYIKAHRRHKSLHILPLQSQSVMMMSSEER